MIRRAMPGTRRRLAFILAVAAAAVVVTDLYIVFSRPGTGEAARPAVSSPVDASVEGSRHAERGAGACGDARVTC